MTKFYFRALCSVCRASPHRIQYTTRIDRFVGRLYFAYSSPNTLSSAVSYA